MNNNRPTKPDHAATLQAIKDALRDDRQRDAGYYAASFLDDARGDYTSAAVALCAALRGATA